MRGFLFDANVLLDIATASTGWMKWSEAHLRSAVASGSVVINPIIYAEIAPAFASRAALDAWLGPTTFQLRPLPYEAAWPAAQAFLKYRRGGGAKSSPLPDFYIGAHAEVEGLTLVTRDATRYRTYFPAVPLIAPP